MSTTPTPTGVNASITNAVNTVSAQINNYLPLATNAVLSVEQTLANAPNQTKLTTALGLILNGAKVGEQIPVPGVAAISSLVDLVGSIVSSFNASGLFSHKSSTTPVIAPVTTPLPVVAASTPVPVTTPAAAASTAVGSPDPSTEIAALQATIATQQAQIAQLLAASAPAQTVQTAHVSAPAASTVAAAPAQIKETFAQETGAQKLGTILTGGIFKANAPVASSPATTVPNAPKP